MGCYQVPLTGDRAMWFVIGDSLPPPSGYCIPGDVNGVNYPTVISVENEPGTSHCWHWTQWGEECCDCGFVDTTGGHAWIRDCPGRTTA